MDPLNFRVGVTVVAIVDLPDATQGRGTMRDFPEQPFVAVGTIGVVVGRRIAKTKDRTEFRFEVVFSPAEDGEPIRRYVWPGEIAKVPVDTKLRKAHPRRAEG